jgi:DNA replicative helicase MCM subunit Mcm2 (Cdc46/Mcm family)
MNFEDQRFLLDIMEEGRFTIDKYGIHQEIDSPTTIIATANPHGAYWKESYKIGNEQIPVANALIDRFDQIYGFTDSQSEEEIKQYAESKIEIINRRHHNYSFLKKYLLYAKTTICPKLTEGAMLNRFWEKLKVDGIATNRTFDTVYRIAESHARLHLKNTVDSEIATETKTKADMYICFKRIYKQIFLIIYYFSAFSNEYVNAPAATTRDDTNRIKIVSNLASPSIMHDVTCIY